MAVVNAKSASGRAAIAGGVLAVVVAIAIIALIIGHSTSTKSESGSHGSASGLQTLAPAKVPPVSAECSERLSFAADGTAAPVTCPNGGVNIRAWQWYAKIGNEITELTTGATPSDVHTTACDDTSNGVSGAEEDDLYTMAAAYYGWHFSYNPTRNLESCPGQQ
jgi:hypothetical protein